MYQFVFVELNYNALHVSICFCETVIANRGAHELNSL